jgi:hypothetical protein
MAFPESILSSFNDLRRHSRALFLPLTAKVPARGAHGKRQPDLSAQLLKNSITNRRIRQDIADSFADRPPFDWALSPPVGTPRDRAKHCLGPCAPGFGAIAKIIHSTQMRKAAAL